MNKPSNFLMLLAIALASLLSACGNAGTPAETETPTPPLATNTPDRCAPENIEAEVQKVHKYMREFDDASSLAASLPREQLADAIANLQKIRREAEDQPTPHCLADLKTYQISHMNAVINTLIAFIGGSEQQVVDQGIALAREQHDRYTVELARVLGLTMVPATILPLATTTPVP